MSNRMKFNFPEAKLYWIVIFIFCLIITYFDFFIGIFSLLILGYLIFYNDKLIKFKNNNFLVDLKNLSIDMNEMSREVMLFFPEPFVIIDSTGKIGWNNNKISEIFKIDDMIGKNLKDLTSLQIKDILPSNGKDKILNDFIMNNRHYDVHGIDISKNSKSKKYAIYFFDKSKEVFLNNKYNDIKPAVLFIQIDNFEDVMESTKDDFKPLLEADIERRIRMWLERVDGIINKISKNKYFAVIKEKNVKVLEEEKFNILDDVREIEFSNTIPVTLSIGLSTYMNNLSETYKNALSSLELSLGRGGDQAVCKINDKTIFYGGKSQAIEKKSRVRARIVAHATKNLIEKSSNILIMGHTYPDLDALGADMGMLFICNYLKKNAKIVLKESNESIDVLYKKIIKIDEYKDVFVSHEEAVKLINDNTLLIVLDTHKKSIADMQTLPDLVKNVMFIDHHRRGVEFLDKAILKYHETYVSSTCEMVTEIMQYIFENGKKLDKITAEALLAGITLDTKNFAFKTGVRTFEAAAYLRKNGADPLEVKKYFQGNYENFLLIASCIQNSKVIDDTIVISSYEDKVENSSLIASQIADELLNIRGIQASFVVIEGVDNKIHVSARSLEKINVQVIMEKLGGGGHIDQAATQIIDKTVQEVVEMVENTAKSFLKEEGIKADNSK